MKTLDPPLKDIQLIFFYLTNHNDNNSNDNNNNNDDDDDSNNNKAYRWQVFIYNMIYLKTSKWREMFEFRGNVQLVIKSDSSELPNTDSPLIAFSFYFTD